MITVTNVSVQFGSDKLFSDVNLKFNPGNCYGIIGANGAGKSTFLKLLSGEFDTSKGDIVIPPKKRISVLKQDHYQYDDCQVLETVIMGNKKLYEIMKEKDAIYAKEDFTDKDGLKASQLEAEFVDLNGWDALPEATRMLKELGIDTDLHTLQMKDLDGGDKVKVLLAQALFGQPDILLLDEPTNNLDISSVDWLENFLLNFPNIVIVVSHDRHFLNTVCTHIVDIDYKKIKLYVGNYDFWSQSSQLIQQLTKKENQKKETRIKELEDFVARFSANKSKSKQATSRKKLLEKISIEEMPSSSRKYPFVGFKADREVGNEVLHVEGLSKIIDGEKILDNISFRINKGDKVIFLGENEIATTTLFQILAGEIEADTGIVKWGVTTSQSYFPKDNSGYFNDSNLNLIKWLAQFSDDKTENFLRSFLGRMLFSGEDALKEVDVLSGGEKVRCMLSKMMLSGANVLLLDQPTNHLDLESITALNNGLIDFKENILFTSHDHQFTQTIANRVIDIKGDGLVDKLMSFDEYLKL